MNNYESLKLKDSKGSMVSLFVSAFFYLGVALLSTFYLSRNRLDLTKEYKRELMSNDRSEVRPFLDEDDKDE